MSILNKSNYSKEVIPLPSYERLCDQENSREDSNKKICIPVVKISYKKPNRLDNRSKTAIFCTRLEIMPESCRQYNFQSEYQTKDEPKRKLITQSRPRRSRISTFPNNLNIKNCDSINLSQKNIEKNYSRNNSNFSSPYLIKQSKNNKIILRDILKLSNFIE